MRRPLLAIVVVSLSLHGSTAPAAMRLQSYVPEQHDRFFDSSDPNKAFIGDPYDWSGVGRDGRWATMISPSYFLSSDHTQRGGSLYFYQTNDPDGPREVRTIESGTQIAGTDLWLGKLTTPVDRNVAKYPILSLPENSDYDDRVIYTFGLSAGTRSPTAVRLGRNTIDPADSGSYQIVTDNFGTPGMAYVFDYDVSGGVGADESQLRSGDSGGPSFTIYDDSPALVGIHWFVWEADSVPTVVGSGDSFVPEYVDQISAAMAGEELILLPEPVLTWDGLGDGNWDSADQWSGGRFPGIPTSVVVQDNTVALDVDGGAYSLLIDDGGSVVVGLGNTLEVVTDAEIANGALDLRGVLNARSVQLSDSTLSIGPGGRLNVDDTLTMEDTRYVSRIEGAANGSLDAGGDVVLAAESVLSVQVVGKLPAVGVQTRTVIRAEAIEGTFAQQPERGDHLGFGVFYQDVGHPDNALTVTLFQAADGDANGDGRVDFDDIRKILGAEKFNTNRPADWTEGDFNGDGMTNFGDIRALLATDLWNKGPYINLSSGAGKSGAGISVLTVPEPSTLAMLAAVLGLLLAIRLCRRPD